MEELKKKIKAYRDYWGLEVHYQEEIDNATAMLDANDNIIIVKSSIKDPKNIEI